MATVNETIARAIAASIEDNEGKFSVEVEIDANTTIEVSGSYEIEGYKEDDYFNGTGAWNVTQAMVIVGSYEVFSYDEDGEEVESSITLDLSAIERYAEDELAA